MQETHDELLALLTAEGDDASQQRAVAHVRGCAACREGLKRGGAVVDALLEGGPAAPAPSAQAVERLVAAAAKRSRLDHFAARVGELFDLSLADARALLARANGTEGWEEGPGPGVWVLPVNAGPRVTDSITALVKVDAGAQFPQHEHLGPEKVLVLEGGFVDSQGHEFWRGEQQEMEPGTGHSFTALSGIGCVCAAVNALMPA